MTNIFAGIREVQSSSPDALRQSGGNVEARESAVLLENAPDAPKSPAGVAGTAISRDWCIRMAQAEDGGEIGAGLAAAEPRRIITLWRVQFGAHGSTWYTTEAEARENIRWHGMPGELSKREIDITDAVALAAFLNQPYPADDDSVPFRETDGEPLYVRAAKAISMLEASGTPGILDRATLHIPSWSALPGPVSDRWAGVKVRVDENLDADQFRLEYDALVGGLPADADAST